MNPKINRHDGIKTPDRERKWVSLNRRHRRRFLAVPVPSSRFLVPDFGDRTVDRTPQSTRPAGHVKHLAGPRVHRGYPPSRVAYARSEPAPALGRPTLVPAPKAGQTISRRRPRWCEWPRRRSRSVGIALCWLTSRPLRWNRVRYRCWRQAESPGIHRSSDARDFGATSPDRQGPAIGPGGASGRSIRIAAAVSPTERRRTFSHRTPLSDLAI